MEGTPTSPPADLVDEDEERGGPPNLPMTAPSVHPASAACAIPAMRRISPLVIVMPVRVGGRACTSPVLANEDRRKDQQLPRYYRDVEEEKPIPNRGPP